MKNFLSLVLSFFIIMASVPVVAVIYKDEILAKTAKVNEAALQEAAGENASEKSEATEKSEAAEKSEKAETSEPTAKAAPAAAGAQSAATAKPDKVKVLLHENKKVVSVKTEFYIISVLAKEIDIASPAEALKAQAVCIYTFLLRARAQSESREYDITDDPAHHQSFLTEAALKKFWGEQYKANYQKLAGIVQAVDGIYLDYAGEPALAAYHSSNAGLTESAESYWGEAYPYLQPVESIGDALCADYKQAVAFTPAQLKKALATLKDKKFRFAESPSDWLGSADYTPSHTVKSLTVGGTALSGRELRQACKLKSSFFTVTYKGGKFIFTVSGYGHGVGMSQEGAKYMAALGFSYREILLHYYNGVAIKGANAV